MSENASCQSCGMPMARDAAGGGTNADGTKSVEYCSHCYAQGAFTMPNLTVDQMAARVGERLRSMSVPAGVVSDAMARIPTLRRWRA